MLFGALDPAVKRWYIPQELFNEYRWKHWEYSNYARQHYQRYVGTALEGNYYYDVYGNLLTRGWLVYDWQRHQPGDLGNSIFKDNRYGGWFSQVLITSDQKGQYQYALTIGDRIRSSLTPLTFSKPAFNGIQADFVTDKYEATVLMSRVSQPEVGSTQGVPRSVTNSTDFLGTHLTAQVGDFVDLGATYLNVHQTQTLIESFVGADRTGTLTTDQNRDPVTAIEIILADDSPEDGEAGAALFSENITITSRDFETGEQTVVEGRHIGFAPVIQGGFQRRGFLSANGEEEIRLLYDFTSPTYLGPDPTTIIAVEFELVVANDYRVLVQSDRQLGGRGTAASPRRRPRRRQRPGHLEPAAAALRVRVADGDRDLRSRHRDNRCRRPSGATPRSPSTAATAAIRTPTSRTGTRRAGARPAPGWPTSRRSPSRGSSSARPSAWKATTTPASC